ncbi:MAG TPA: methyl-accepting chemotaxis protein, partial [Blastocatellia bacterium]|nr:methyl-accepting chemotaxis protein [Blastocatellia bacterium]
EKDFLLSLGNKEKESEALNRWDEARKQLGSQIQVMLSYVSFSKESDAIKVIKDDLTAYDDAVNKVVSMVREGSLRTPQDANSSLSEAKTPLRSLDTGNRLLLDDVDKRLEGKKETLIAGTKQGGGNIFLLVVFGALFASYVVFSTVQNFNKQTKSITDLITSLSKGNLDARAEVYTNDELGQMARSFNDTLDNSRTLMQSREEHDQMQHSIVKLLDQVAGVAEGDLTREAEVTSDITGAIADSFNFMITELRRIISKVQDVTLAVSSSANETQATTEHLAQGSEKQAAQILDTSQAIDEMAASIQQVSEHSVMSATVAQQSLANAKQGSEAVQATIKGMSRIREQVQETSKRIKRLGESSQEIGEIVQLIDDIADRTSILALNASIQAAMAGEAGRGFAVVAEEVERLAERSSDATKRITNLVKTIQMGTNEAIAAMEESTHEVVEGSKLANQAGQALGEIESVSNRLADIIQSISLTAKQQARGSEALAKSMGNISDITQHTAAGIKQSAIAVNNLAGLADELRSSVASFKLPSGYGNGNGHSRGNGHGHGSGPLDAFRA